MSETLKALLAEIDRIEADYVDGGEECRGQDTRLYHLMNEVRAALMGHAPPELREAPVPPIGSVCGIPCEIVQTEATGANPPANPDDMALKTMADEYYYVDWPTEGATSLVWIDSVGQVHNFDEPGEREWSGPLPPPAG